MRALEKCDDVAFTPDDVIIVKDFIKNGPGLALKKPKGEPRAKL